MRLLALALVLLLPLAAAQTLINPVKGEYTEVYIIAGRAIDAVGRPAAGATIVVELEQKGIRAEPLEAKADCFGVFITFFDLKEVRGDGAVKLTLKGRAGGPDATASAPLDHFYRRTDMTVRYEGQWDSTCPTQTPFYPNRVSVTGRIVNRTEPYQRNDVTYHAKPYDGNVRFRYWDSPTRFTCPPAPADPTLCDPDAGTVDERGDFKYSWVFDDQFEVPEGAKVEVLAGGKSYNFTVDREWRVAAARIEATGRGPAPLESPGIPLAALISVVALAALLWRRTRR